MSTKISLFIVIICCAVLLVATIKYRGNALNTQRELASLRKQFDVVQRIGDTTKDTAEKGLGHDTKFIKRAKEIKRRVSSEFSTVSEAGEALARELRNIIEKSDGYKYRGVDSRGNFCFNNSRPSNNRSGKEIDNN